MEQTDHELTGYRRLRVWQRSMELAEACYWVVRSFPAEERYAISQQIWRSSYSVPSNIAEVYSRGTRKEDVQFLWIAHGSLRELETHLLLCSRVGLLATEQANSLLEQCDEVGKMLHGLIRKLTSPSRSPAL